MEWASESTCLTMFRSISWTIAFSQKPNNNNNNVCRAQSNHDGQLILFKTIVYIYYRTTISSCPLKTNSELSFSSISLSVLYLFHFYLVSQIPRVVPIHCVKLKKKSLSDILRRHGHILGRYELNLSEICRRGLPI